MANLPLLPREKCDGNHALSEPCADPNCWHGDDNPLTRAPLIGDSSQTLKDALVNTAQIDPNKAIATAFAWFTALRTKTANHPHVDETMRISFRTLHDHEPRGESAPAEPPISRLTRLMQDLEVGVLAEDMCAVLFYRKP